MRKDTTIGNTNNTRYITSTNREAEDTGKDLPSAYFRLEDAYTSIFADFPDVLTISQMQKALAIGKSTAYKLINSNAIKHIRIGKSIKIPKIYLVEYISQVRYTTTSNEQSCLSQPKEDLQ